MNLSNFTIKAAEVIQGAQQIAFNQKTATVFRFVPQDFLKHPVVSE